MTGMRFDDSVVNGFSPVSIAAMLELDLVARDRFRSRYNQPNVYGALFGGQIVAQALAAADVTVGEEREVHSLHAYFLRAGKNSAPIDFDVERVRDGRRFSSRRVLAIQDSKTLLSMDCSYRVAMQGYSHQRDTALLLNPDAGIDKAYLAAAAPPEMQEFLAAFVGHYPIDMRISSPMGYLETTPDAKRHYWLRAPGSENIDDPRRHRQILAFLSDFMLAGAPLIPHTIAIPGPHVFVASLDHALWIHRPVRCDEWLLFETDSPSAEGGVNMARALVYDRQGRLVASVAQEVLQLPTDRGTLGSPAGAGPADK